MSGGGNNMTWNAVKRLCGIFCCPPCPARIAAKLAFMPPAPTYAIIDDISADGVVKKKLELTEEAEWQFTQRELDCIEPFMTHTSRGETIACIYIHCYPHAKYTLLFRYLLLILFCFAHFIHKIFLRTTTVIKCIGADANIGVNLGTADVPATCYCH